MAKSICKWDSLAEKYDRLWVQRYSLTPTRNVVKSIIAHHFSDNTFSLLDMGCGTGQLLFELQEQYPKANLMGLDKSQEMVRMAQRRGGDIQIFCGDVDTEDLTQIIAKNSLDIIVCCHSFPYYRQKIHVLEKMHRILSVNGIAIFVQASINNIYDRRVLHIVEATAEKAEYLSRKAFRYLIQDSFEVVDEFCVHEKFFMPSICGFILCKRT